MNYNLRITIFDLRSLNTILSFRRRKNLKIMKSFQGKKFSLIQRLLYVRNLIYIISLFFYSYLILIFKPVNDYKFLLIFLLSIFLLLKFYLKTRLIINKITFENNNILFEGDKFNTTWKKSIEITNSEIFIISEGSKTGICGAKFHLKFKNKKDNYILNYYQNFSNHELVKIFKEFKSIKEEKIIIDEKLLLNRIQEKIVKCQ